MTGYRQDYVQNEKTIGTHSTCFLCSENIFEGDLQNTENGGNGNISYGVNPNIKIEEGYCTSERIPLRGICRYLGIDFQQILTRDADKLPEDELPDLSVAFCIQCSSIVSPLSALCNQLDLLQMKVNYYLKSVIAVAERLSGDKTTENTTDESNQKLAQLLRIEISKKGKAKLNQTIPKVELINNSSAQLCINFFDGLPSSVKNGNVDKEKYIFHHVRKLKGRKRTRKEIQEPKGDDFDKTNFNSEECVNNNFKCGSCDKVFRSKSDLQSHVILVHNKETALKRYVCSVCGKIFKDSAVFYKHRKLGHDEQGKPNVINCEICNKVFSSIGSLLSHKKVMHEGVKYIIKCKICDEVFKTRRALNTHKKVTNHDEALNNNFKCTSCSKVFRWKTNLRDHVKVVHNKKQHVCDFCGKVFSHFRNLYKHKISHIEGAFEKQQHVCDVCGKVFQYRRSLNQHIKFKHQKPKCMDDFKCDVCDKLFSLPSSLQRHKKTKHQRDMEKLQDSKGRDFDKVNLNSKEGEPVVKVNILPKFTEEQDTEHPVEGSKVGMHRDGSTDYHKMKEEHDHFYSEYVNPSVSSNSNDHFDFHSDEFRVEVKIVPD